MTISITFNDAVRNTIMITIRFYIMIIIGILYFIVNVIVI